MGICVTYSDDGGVHFKATGILEGEEAIRHNREVYANEEKIRNIRYQIIDLTDVETFKVSENQIILLAIHDSHAADINPDMCIAIVVSDRFIFGMNRMYQAHFLGNPDNLALLPSLEDARSWIAERARMP